MKVWIKSDTNKVICNLLPLSGSYIYRWGLLYFDGFVCLFVLPVISGNVYNITNLRKDEAKLTFFQLKSSWKSDEEKQSLALAWRFQWFFFRPCCWRATEKNQRSVFCIKIIEFGWFVTEILMLKIQGRYSIWYFVWVKIILSIWLS